MKKFLLLPALSIFIGCVTNAQKFDLYISNITIIPMNRDIALPNQSVGIRNDKIMYIGENIPANAKIKIDGTGKYLMPSLYDMHTHLPSKNEVAFFKLFLAAGIAKIRIMNSDGYEPNLYKNMASKMPMPLLSIGFPVDATTIQSAEQIPNLVDSIKQAGYRFIKIFSIAKPAYFSVLMHYAKKKKIPVCGHSLSNIALQELIESGYNSIEHLGYLDKMSKAGVDSTLPLLVQYHTTLCPTLDWLNMVNHTYPKYSLFYRAGYTIGKKIYGNEWDSIYTKTAASLAENKTAISKNMNAKLAKKIEILAQAKKFGINVVAGADAEEPYQTPGFSLIEELLLIKKANYSNYELLKTVTVNCSKYFKEEKKYGSIEKGKQASLIILAKNPLDDIRNLETVETLIFNKQILQKADIISTF